MAVVRWRDHAQPGGFDPGMTTRPQPGGIERDLDVLRTISRERDGCLAIGALVVQPGAVRVGDALTPI